MKILKFYKDLLYVYYSPYTPKFQSAIYERKIIKIGIVIATTIYSVYEVMNKIIFK